METILVSIAACILNLRLSDEPSTAFHLTTVHCVSLEMAAGSLGLLRPNVSCPVSSVLCPSVDQFFLPEWRGIL